MAETRTGGDIGPRASDPQGGGRRALALLAVAVLAVGCTGASKSAKPSPGPSSTAPTPASSQPAAAAAAPVTAAAPVGVADAASHTFPLSPSPYALGFDAATRTLYVSTDDGVAVLNAASCSATDSSGCRAPVATVGVGAIPNTIAIDHTTDTVYVTADDSSVMSVIDGKTCNATVSTGCAATPPTVNVGQGPDGIAVDESTNTVYVANNEDSTISVVDGSTCDATVISGCGQAAATIPGINGQGPTQPAVDEQTDTIYVPNNDGSLSVIDGAHCQAKVTTGCATAPFSVILGDNMPANVAAVDQATNTVYVAADNPTGGTVFVIKGATCDSATTSGCGQIRPDVTVGSHPVGIAIDPRSHNLFVLNVDDDSMSIIDGAACNSAVETGCTYTPLTMATGASPGYLDIDPATDTLYVSNSQDNDVSVLSDAACSAPHPAGCSTPPVSTAAGKYASGLAVNPFTGTVYVANAIDADLTVIDAASCNAVHTSGCGQTWKTAPATTSADGPLGVAVDDRTNTVYVTDGTSQDSDDGSPTGFQGSTISVVDGAHCDAADTAGCGALPVAVTVGSGPSALAVDETTNTIYVTNFEDGTVSVIDGATCNGTVTTGCATAPVTVKVGSNPDGVAVDEKTDTVYVADNGSGTVSVINGATCRGGVTTGCTQTPKTVNVGDQPVAVAVNPVTNTVYVANYQSSTVSVIDGATCDATVTTGCSRKSPTMATGAWPKRMMAIDTATDTLFVTSLLSDVVDVFKASTCNATVTTGCSQRPTAVPVGGIPVGVVFDPITKTVYVSDNADSRVSLFAPPA